MTEEVRWGTPRNPILWEKLKPLAREMRKTPTAPENRLWQRLRRRQVEGFKFRRQHGIERFIVDFYCAEAKLIIEVDGSTHEGLEAQTYDQIRSDYFEEMGLRVIRFTNHEVMTNLEGVITVIANHLHEM